jgi:predicted dehydrogenase
MNITRRSALRRTAALGLASSLASLPSAQSLRAASSANRKIRAAVVALGRGMAHVSSLLSLPDVEIAGLAEVDPARLDAGLQNVAAKQSAPCRGASDFRTLLEDKSIDAIFIATPNFWHTPAALLALEAGKHVYVEKPGSGTPAEARLLVAAQRKHGHLVQMGNQRRTWMKEAIAALHGGVIGNVKYARSFYYASRGPIAENQKPAPAGLNLELWKGPVPDDPSRNILGFIHYNWHWLWHWGNGEMGNNAVHTLDVLRWGLQTRFPKRITYSGRRYWHDDAQETPDTGTALFDFGHCAMEWVQSSCSQRAAEKPLGECVFYGTLGTLAISRNTWSVFDPKGVKISEEKGPHNSDPAHIGNFLDAIRGNASLNSPIHEGQISTLTCHLANIAYRTGSVVECDPLTGGLINHPQGEKLWTREYRKGWEPKL